MQEEPVYDKEGNPTGEYRFDSAGAIGALRILAKFLGMERPQSNTSKPAASA